MSVGVSIGLLVLGLVVVLLVRAIARRAPLRSRRVVYFQSSRDDRQGLRRTVVR